MYQFIRPQAVLHAVKWLVSHNSLYRNITITQNWPELCSSGDAEDWRILTGNSDNQRDLSTTLSQNNETKDIADHESDTCSSDEETLVQKVRGLKYSTCLQPTDPQYTLAQCLAPAEGQTPLDLMLDCNAEVLAFPSKFPLGRFGMTQKRQVALTPKKYFVQRILNKDKRFASDPNYLFYAQYITEMKQVRDNITVALRKTTGKLRAGDIISATQLRQLIQDDRAFQFLTNVRGTPPYYARAVKQLLAMVIQLGCPHIFLTLSAADMSWPELFKIIGKQAGRFLTDEEINSMGYEEKASMLRNDPVLAARHFDHRLKTFFRDILMHSHCIGHI